MTTYQVLITFKSGRTDELVGLKSTKESQPRVLLWTGFLIPLRRQPPILDTTTKAAPSIILRLRANSNRCFSYPCFDGVINEHEI